MMRAWFAIVLALAACDGDTRGTVRDAALDAALHRTTFTPLLCTAGTPGDPTCPLNYIDLAKLANIQLRFVVIPESTGLRLSKIGISGSAPVIVEDLAFVVVHDDGTEELVFGPFPSSLDLSTSSTFADVTVDSYSASSQLALQYRAVR